MVDHDHSSTTAQATLGCLAADALVVLALVVAAGGYAVALRSGRGDAHWPAHRTAAWYAGLVCVAAALVGPLASAAHASFTAHMVTHLLIGMVAPLLLVLASPLRLALRAMPVARARSLVRLLRTRVVRVVTHPVTAGVLNGGGLWLLYLSDLYPRMHTSPLVHAHVLLVDYLFTAAVVGVDPDPHRASVTMRAAVLVIFVAAHSILAKRLYADPPTGVEAGDGQVGAQVMYHGGDVVDVTLMVLLMLGWYRGAGRVGVGERTRGSPLRSSHLDQRR